jgi:hypothetical protein
MIIILKNIPAKTKKQNVQDFLTSTIKGGWFNKRGAIQNISMLSRKNTRTHDIQYHSLVDILPDSVAERVIRQLNRKIILGKRIAISEYRIRNWHNDPRINKNTNKRLNDSRIIDRRSKYEDVISEEVAITSKRAFHTKGW